MWALALCRQLTHNRHQNRRWDGGHLLLRGDCADEMGAVLSLVATIGVTVIQVVPAQVEASVHRTRRKQPNRAADQRVRT